jgi:hypothetical protein
MDNLAIAGEGEMRTNSEGFFRKREGGRQNSNRFSLDFSSLWGVMKAFLTFLQLLLIYFVDGRRTGNNV